MLNEYYDIIAHVRANSFDAIYMSMARCYSNETEYVLSTLR